MICGKCKDTGVTIAHVRACYSAAAPKPQPVLVQGALFDPATQAEPTPAPVVLAKAPSVTELASKTPVSHYAVPGPGGALGFFEVRKGLEDRHYIRRLIGAPKSWRRVRMAREEALEVLASILVDPAAAAKTYADKYRCCACCGANLSDKASRDRGLGPDCAKRFAA